MIYVCLVTASGTTTLDQYQRKKSSLIGSMQRTRGMGRPHQGDPSSTELNSQTPVVPSEIVPTQQHQQSHPPRPTRVIIILLIYLMVCPAAI